MADQLTAGLNFETDRPRIDILRDFRTVVARTYGPEGFHRRVRSLIDRIGYHNIKVDLRRHKTWSDQYVLIARLCWELGVRAPRGKRLFWGTLRHALRNGNPHALEPFCMSLIPYAHLGPFAQEVLKVIDAKIAALEGHDGRSPTRVVTPPARLPQPA